MEKRRRSGQPRLYAMVAGLICMVLVLVLLLSNSIGETKEFDRLCLDTRGGLEHKLHHIQRRANRVGVLVMDMWDHHCCLVAEDRAAMLAPHINTTLTYLRQLGAHIVHVPYNVVDYYENDPARLRAMRYANSTLPSPTLSKDLKRRVVEGSMPPVTIDNNARATCLCESADKRPNRIYSKQTDAIYIDQKRDIISTNEREVYGYLSANHVNTLLYVGVHLNICVLWYRPLSVVQTREWFEEIIIVRDLVDVLSEVEDYGLPHAEKNAAMTRHIEENWASSISSYQILHQPCAPHPL